MDESVLLRCSGGRFGGKVWGGDFRLLLPMVMVMMTMTKSIQTPAPGASNTPFLAWCLAGFDYCLRIKEAGDNTQFTHLCHHCSTR